jgi:hypothetical protein
MFVGRLKEQKSAVKPLEAIEERTECAEDKIHRKTTMASN